MEDVKALVLDNIARLADRREHITQIVQTVNANAVQAGATDRVLKLHRAYSYVNLSKKIKL
jgi:hypothetical protein